MANKAVLNIKGFALGRSSSMASLVVPTTSLEQDVWPYEIDKDLTGVDCIANAIRSQGNSDNKSADGIYKFLKLLCPQLVNTVIDGDGEHIPILDDISVYTNSDVGYPIFRYYTHIADKVVALQHLVETVNSETDVIVTGEDFSSMVEEIVQEEFPYSFNYVGKPIAALNNAIVAWTNNLVVGIEDEVDEDHPQMREDSILTDEFLEKFQIKLAAIETYLNYGDEDAELPSGIVQNDFPPLRGQWQRTLDAMETRCLPFFNIIRVMIAKEDPVCQLDFTDELISWFENLRLTYNRKLIEEYRGVAVEFPYFLDLGFDKNSMEASDTDSDGIFMHSIERECELGDNWGKNAKYGDRIRIRDMFRVDKLNKKSAYESAALYPGIKGDALDKTMENEDVITRLAQNDWDVNGVIGSTSTTDGMYFLTDASDSVTSSVRSVTMNDLADGVTETNTFRNFNKDPTEVHYLTTVAVPSTTSLQRVYNGESDDYSSGSEFLDWYKKHHRCVVIHPASIYSESSTLKVLGELAYDFYPSEDGVMVVEDVYNPDTETDKDEELFRQYPADLTFRAGIGESNYKSDVARRLTIEVPYNPNNQYSYISFTVGVNIDQNLGSLITEDKYMRMSLSLDREHPITYDLLTGENDWKENPYSSLYYPLRKLVISKVGSTKIELFIENNLLSEQPRMVHIDLVSNYPQKLSSMSETLRKAFDNTYMFVSNPSVKITNVTGNMTYGDYHEFRKNEGESVLDYWNLSRSVHGNPYQYILEVPNLIPLGMSGALSSNYQTADLYSDVITAKNQMDSEYKMQVNSEKGEFIIDRFRKYTGIDSCSNTISLYFDADMNLVSNRVKRPDGASNAAIFENNENEETSSEHSHSSQLRYKRIETIKSVNRFTETIKHKSNLFSVEVNNSRINDLETLKEEASTDEERKKIEDAAEKLKRTIETMVRNICNEYAPVHNQLFKVYVS